MSFKTQFQEYVHSQNKGDVTYQLIKEPAHHRLFTSEVILENKAVAEVKERQKESEQKAAEQAYKLMKNKNHYNYKNMIIYD